MSDVFVHPKALCESTDIGSGTRIWAFAHVMRDAVIGEDCNICDHVFIEDGSVIGDRCTIKNGVMIWDGVTIEDDVFVGPGVIFTNDRNPRAEIKKNRDQFDPTFVRSGATIGAGAVIIAGTAIERYGFVGAGSVVTRRVLKHELVVGNPARHKGWMCRCGERVTERGRHLSCTSCDLVFFKQLDGLVVK